MDAVLEFVFRQRHDLLVKTGVGGVGAAHAGILRQKNV